LVVEQASHSQRHSLIAQFIDTSRQTILVSRGSAQQHVKDLLESTVAIAFMGTPHLGASLANLGHPISKLSNLLRKTNSEIVEVLQPGSEMLAAVQQEFRTMLDDQSRNNNMYINIFCFYEEVGYTGIGKVRDPYALFASEAYY